MSSRARAALCIEIGKPNLFRQDFFANPYFQSKQLLVLLSKRHFGDKILEECIYNASCKEITKFKKSLSVQLLMLHSVTVGNLEVRDRKSELPTCLHSDQLGTFNSERVARWTESIYLFLFGTRST